MKKQVESDHYRFERYSSPLRWVSYYWQIRLALNHSPRKILEIGVGDGVFGRYVKEVGKIDYKSVDIDSDLKPDIVGEVTKLPVPDASFDTVCIFEVLEHLPFDTLKAALKELNRVTQEYVIVSVPDRRPYFRFFFKIPFFREIKWQIKLPISRPGTYGRQHYWEIGWEGYPLNRAKKAFEEYFIIEKSFVPFENPHHHFFILKKI